MDTTKLFPVLASVQEAKQRGDASRAAGRGGFPGADFGPTVTIILVIEDGETLTWVDSVMLEEIGRADPFDLAISNLRARTTVPLRRQPIVPGQDAWFVGENDGLDSGRLLLHDLWASLKADLPGELLVRVVQRGVVLCCSNLASSVGLVDKVAEQIVEKGALQGAAIVTPSWLIWTEHGWGEPEL